jgi:uncharacterized metal-binding protein
MNERIRELAEQAGFNSMGIWNIIGIREYHEKFAELLAQDAISIVQSFCCKMDASNDNIVEALKQHFGVE